MDLLKELFEKNIFTLGDLLLQCDNDLILKVLDQGLFIDYPKVNPVTENPILHLLGNANATVDILECMIKTNFKLQTVITIFVGKTEDIGNIKNYEILSYLLKLGYKVNSYSASNTRVIQLIKLDDN